MPSELITLEYLYNLAGMAAAVVLVVSFLKWIAGLTGRGAKVAAWITALVIVVVVYLNQGMFHAGISWANLATVLLMVVLNSILVTFVAMKSYEEVVEPITKKLQAPQQQDPGAPLRFFHRNQHRE